ncbi:hypothetical protein CLIB1444_01S06876 [[Candida] jaroonii]|uniref:Uncharacterized protein n=1 Tax=[Candida] jaroonii TaxID=467808 RepID=A0ACA9Y0J6_9ASCO|nr:hypothetical protein CLIB1444_01S06876 [[Candida] jaroonii]
MFSQRLPKAPLDGDNQSPKFNRLSMNLSNSQLRPQSPSSESSRARRKPPPDLIGEVQMKNANKINEERLNSSKSRHELDDIIKDLETEIDKYNITSDPFDNTMDSSINNMDDSNIEFDDPFIFTDNGHEGKQNLTEFVPPSGDIQRLDSYNSSSSSVYDSPMKSQSSLTDFKQPPQNYSMFGNSSPSLEPPKENSIPYPLDSPIAPSPTSLTYSRSVESNISDGNQFNAPIYPNEDESLKYNNSNETTPRKLTRNNSLGKVNSQITNASKNQLKPTISTPITNLTFTDSIRNSTSSSQNNAPAMNPAISPNIMKSSHRKSSSMSSIWSSNSNRNINLATLKKTFNLRVGEGERSNYVITLRKNAGTAYNETAPGKWKLPIGISPIDKRATYTSMRMGISQKAKKGSGVELKHGHLAPRLLAAEVDDMDDARSLKGLRTTNTSTSLGNSSLTTNSSGSNGIRTSNSSTLLTNDAPSIKSIPSNKNSLSRTITENSTTSSIITTNDNSKTPSSKRSSSISSSSGSISDDDVQVGGFYQHPGYKYDEEDEDNLTHKEDIDAETEVENTDIDDNDKEPPRLFLANPDNDSDSD